MKLLIVEDDQSQANALRKLLKVRMEYLDCQIVPTLGEALRWSQKFEADVTLLDLMLPDASVDEVIESIPRFHPPVIVVTEHEDDDNSLLIKCFVFEAKGFHKKSRLLAKINSLEGKIAAEELKQSIIDSHFRHVLPSRKQEFSIAKTNER